MRGTAAVSGVLLALALASPALAQVPCVADFPDTAPAPQPGAKLRFGIYPGGVAGQLGPVPAPAVRDAAHAREARRCLVRR